MFYSTLCVAKRGEQQVDGCLDCLRQHKGKSANAHPNIVFVVVAIL